MGDLCPCLIPKVLLGNFVFTPESALLTVCSKCLAKPGGTQEDDKGHDTLLLR